MTEKTKTAREPAVVPQPVKRRPARTRLGLDGYARIYVRLKKGASEEDLRIEGYVSSKFNVKRIIASFYKLGRIRVKEWRVNRGRPVHAVYCHSDAAPDAEPPALTATGHLVRNPHIPSVAVVPIELLAFNSLLDALEDRVLTRKQIRERTGLDEITINNCLRRLCPSVAHLCAWVPARADKGMLAAAYTLGSGQSVPRPVKTAIERQREWRRRNAIKAACPMAIMADRLTANDVRRAA